MGGVLPAYGPLGPLCPGAGVGGVSTNLKDPLGDPNQILGSYLRLRGIRITRDPPADRLNIAGGRVAAGGAGQWRWEGGAEASAASALGAGENGLGRGLQVCARPFSPTVTHPSRRRCAAGRPSGDSETALGGAPHWSDRIPQPSCALGHRKGTNLGSFFLSLVFFLIEHGNLPNCLLNSSTLTTYKL